MAVEALKIVTGNTLKEPSDEELLSFLLARGVEVMYSREGGLFECAVPTELIDHEEVPVKKEWAESLAYQMKAIAEIEGGSGQQQAIGLGFIPGQSLLKIIDGFHRDAALEINNERIVYATVKLTDWDKLYDQRIFTAKDHAHVRFSRVVQWIREVWNYSGLSDVMTVEQAILLYRFETDGSKLGIDPEKVRLANEWVRTKEAQWDMAAMTIHSHLKIAENVDPRLVHSTREKKSGNVLEAPSQTILKIFSQNLPGNFDFQNLVMNKAMQHNLKGPEVRALSMAVKDCDDLFSATAIIDGMDLAKLKPAYRETKVGDLRRAHDPKHLGARALDKATDEISGVLNRTLQIEDRAEKIEDDMVPLLNEAKQRATKLIVDLGSLSTQIDRLLADRHTVDVVRNLTNYILGKTDAPPDGFTKAHLQEAWVRIDSSDSNPKGWKERFRDLQPQIAKARQEERVGRDL